MSKILAKVKEIESVDNLNIVKFDCNDTTLSMMSLELNKNIQVGTNVKLSSKPTHIAIGKDFTGNISYSNALHVEIIKVTNGGLLTALKLQFHDTILESIITRESSDKMSLHVGDKVTAFIKANELSIVEVLDD